MSKHHAPTRPPLRAWAVQACKRTPVVAGIARWVHGHLTGKFRNDPTRLIAQHMRSHRATFVQIGSNDGQAGDPLRPLLLRHPLWECLFVEPLPVPFARLRAGYGDDARFRFENAAINDGTRQVFYFVDEEAAEHLGFDSGYVSQLGSFSRSHIVRHLGKQVEPWLREMEIEGLTLDALFEKHQIREIDVLHVDAEGMDWKILRQLDLARMAPKIILFEHLHLDAKEIADAQDTLGRYYRMKQLPADYFCLRLSSAPISGVGLRKAARVQPPRHEK